LIFGALTVMPENAAGSYSARLVDQFVSWCTTSQNQPQTVCSCAVNKAAIEISASSMASFLNASSGNGMAAMSQGVGATALQIVTTCAASSGNAGANTGSLMKSLGGAFGQ